MDSMHVFEAAQSAKAYQHCLHFRYKISETFGVSSSQFKHRMNRFRTLAILIVASVLVKYITKI